MTADDPTPLPPPQGQPVRLPPPHPLPPPVPAPHQPPLWAPPPRQPVKVSRRVVRRVYVVGILLVLLAIASFIKLPYVVISPGPAVNVLGTIEKDGKDVPIIEVPSGKEYPTTGTLDLTTVRISGGPGYSVTVFDVVYGWLSPKREVYDVDLLYPPEATADQVQQESAEEMRDSQEDAAAVAERALGYTVTESIAIASLAPDSPAKDLLKVGDTISSIGGVTTPSGDSVREQIQKVTAGQRVEMVVERDGRSVAVSVPTRRADDGRTVVGVTLRARVDLPVKVTINAGSIGGPSAGLMFALSIYDKLSPGPLTGGTAIAGTGTISPNGDVGPIGGIREKLYGAEEGGAKWFLAPEGNCAEVVDHVPDGLRVIKVGTFADGLAAVKAIAAGAADALPRC